MGRVSGASVIDRVAMALLEEKYPDMIKRFDELYDKEKKGLINDTEKRELDMLDYILLREYERIRRWLRLNWLFMPKERKLALLEKVRI